MNAKRLLIILAVILASAYTLCFAQGAEMEFVLQIEPDVEQITIGGLESDAAFEGYVNQLFGIARPQPLRLMAVRFLGASLTGNDKAIYDALKEQIIEVAAGERASTVLTVTAAQMGLEGHYYAEDLGVASVIDGNQISSDAANAMWEKQSFNSKKIFSVLLRDCPYEMYWCDKTIGAGASSFGISAEYDNSRKKYCLYFTGNMTFSFAVAEAYRPDGSTGRYTVDTAIAQTASAAAVTAQGVVESYAYYEDDEKLLYYKNWICDHVSYNSAAASGGAPYGDPWQLIWVFDGDENTRVVCEGYSKAFQYLCDMSDFLDDVDCRTITGTMGSENHMWNIVGMPNGKNYMVDVTNCDGSSIGSPDKLFLAGTDNGNVDDGYTMAVGQGVLYKYDDNTRDLFSDSELTLSNRPYKEEKMGIPIDERHFPDEQFRGFVAQYDTDPEGGDEYLSDEERDAVIAMDVSDKGIGSLVGIRYFRMLEALDCSENDIGELDISKCAALKTLAVHANLSIADSLVEYSDGSDALRFDLGVRLIRTREKQETLTLPAATQTVGADTFAGTAVEIVVIPQGCSGIGDRAFANCASLAEVRMPEGLSADAISSSAFSGSEDAIIVTGNEDIQAWAVENGMLWTDN